MTKEGLVEGSILLIDKPLTWTSFNVVSKIRHSIRKQFHLKKIKVGHAGTLDPLATGLLLICTGRKTKEVERLQGCQKEYIARIEFGKTTPSYDLETSFDAEYDYKHITVEKINQAFKNFIGEIDQIPPLFSAKFVDGKRAYKLARQGSDMELKPSRITIWDLEILSFENFVLEVRIVCSKGTYIRSFAYDLGRALDSGAYLKALRRTISGDYNIKDAITLEEFQEKLLSLQA